MCSCHSFTSYMAEVSGTVARHFKVRVGYKRRGGSTRSPRSPPASQCPPTLGWFPQPRLPGNGAETDRRLCVPDL